MIRFVGKIISNLLAMFVAIGLMVGGCLFVGSAAMKGAADAQKNGGGSLMDAAKNSFSESVARDLIQQYEIVKDGSDEMAKSVRAGAVAEMYLQAKNQSDYELWKARADRHLQAALGK